MKPTVPCIVDLITTDEDKRYELAARMADAIIAISLKQSDCLQQDLLNEGFAHREISAHWHFANALAATELRHMKRTIFSIPQKGVQYA
jgi:hypothetical protein